MKVLFLIVLSALILYMCSAPSVDVDNRNANVNGARPQNGNSNRVVISSFQDCVKYYPVIETYPRTCQTSDKKTFIDDVSPYAANTNFNAISPLKGEGEVCGGIAGFTCDKGLVCKMEGNQPDAAGRCVKETSPDTICTDNRECWCIGFDGTDYNIGKVSGRCDIQKMRCKPCYYQ